MSMRTAAATIVTMLLSACASSVAQADRPAVLVAPNSAARDELLTAIRNALGNGFGNAPLTLADDAFIHDSAVSIERTPRRDANGQLLNGRVMEKPQRFTLYVRGSRCVLVQAGTQREWLLKHANCVPNETP